MFSAKRVWQIFKATAGKEGFTPFLPFLSLHPIMYRVLRITQMI